MIRSNLRWLTQAGSLNLSGTCSVLPPGGQVGTARERARPAWVLLPVLTLALRLLGPDIAVAQVNGIYREVFTGLDRANNSLAQLTNDLRFIASTPTTTSTLSSFRTEQNLGDDYGQRLRAFLVAPATGNYTFAIASDEVSQLFLSVDENPAHKQLIAFVDPRVQPDTFTTFTTQTSSNRFLEASRRYYIEVLHKEANLIDHLSVQWRLPGGALESPIPGLRLVYEIPPLLTEVPRDLVVEEGRPAVWSAGTANFLPQAYRWKRDGLDLAGATNRTLRIPAAALGDDGALFQVTVSNALGTTSPPPVRLVVLRDVQPPRVLGVIAANRTNLLVRYSEPVEAASALDLARYVLPGASILGATASPDGAEVLLRTPPLAPGSTQSLSITVIRDRASQANTLLTTQVLFVVRDFNPGVIGQPESPGAMQESGAGLDVNGVRGTLGGIRDDVPFGYRLVEGDFDVAVRIQSFASQDIWSRAGLMAREGPEAEARFAAALATPTLAGSLFEQRPRAGGPSTRSGSFPATPPNCWLRLARAGDQFLAYASQDGGTWVLLGKSSLALSNQLQLGLVVASQSGGGDASAQFRNFGPVTGLPPTSPSPPTAEPLGPSSRRTGLVISEIQYHPRNVLLENRKAELEFVELFNSNPFPEDLSGFRLSGDVDYVFPSGTTLAGGRFLVVARAPLDLMAVQGISGALGPFTNNLPNDRGQLRLRDPRGTVLLEVNYSSDPPWPVAADGTGHSLVLARPSLGEGDPAAWAASDTVGGSPGQREPLSLEPLREVAINEFLAHNELPNLDFIELHNAGSQPADVSGAFLTDDPATNRFRIPPGTLLPAGGFVSFDRNQLGFPLHPAGGTLLLVNPDATRVLDVVKFGGQAMGVALGRTPDGAPDFRELANPTPGQANPPPMAREIVINEIMYHPISGRAEEEYVELYNRGASPVPLGGWRFIDGIDFTFPSNTVLAAGGYLVVARNVTTLLAQHPGLSPGVAIGDFAGSLRNGGERIALAMPQRAVHADPPGPASTGTVWVVVNEVSFRRGGSWGHWADGGGSSLELMDPRSDNRLGPNWGDSDESAKAGWSLIETTGVLDNGADSPTALHVMLLEEGECLLDNVEVVGTSPANLLANSTFETGTNGWVARGNHQRSSLEPSGGFNSSRSFHLRASSRGDVGANKVFVNLSGLAAGQTATIRARARWLRGWPELLLRLRGSYLEATDRLAVPTHLGTPGAANSRLVANAGPALTAVQHTPAVPAAGEPIRVTARVTDPDGIAAAVVRYRLDPATNLLSLALRDDGTGGDAKAGDGLYTATLPGQPADTLVAFVVEATDGGTPAAASRFPAARDDNGPARECLVHVGGAVPASSFGTYRFWITQASVAEWSAREVLSNERIDGTFVYANHRVIYNAGGRYSGSPAHQDQAAPDYSPIGTPNHYAFDLPADDLLLGTDNFNKIHGPGNNHHDDNTLLREVTAYWMARQLGLPANYKRDVILFINGARRGSLMEDTQVPNGDGVSALFPEDPDGDLFKLSVWYEFGSPAQALSASGLSECYLNNYTTTGGLKKRARYRWNWQGRALNGTANNYTNVYALIDAANLATNAAFVGNLDAVADMDQWMRTFALEHGVGNWDSFGYRNEQNMFAYKPTLGRWQLLIWDINIIFGGGTRGTPVPVDGDLFEHDSANLPMEAIYNHPQFRRSYLRSLRDLVDGPFLDAPLASMLDARFAAFAASGVSVGDPGFIRLWVRQRRDYILDQLRGVESARFSLLSPTSFSTETNLITLSGTAPLAASEITINGVARAIRWMSLSNWTLRLPLEQATNALHLEVLDPQHRPIPGAVADLQVRYTGGLPEARDQIVINEIQYNPLLPGSSFLELFNTSSNFTFDLSGWQLNGLDYTFPPGSFITNRQYLVLAGDRAIYSQLYGPSNLVAGQFAGRLQNDGETLTLERPLASASPASRPAFAVVDRVRYERSAPWPVQADGTGASLQLIDAAQDNSRAGSWDAGSGWVNITRTGNIAAGNTLLVFLSAAGSCFIDDITLIGPAGTNLLVNGDFETELAAPWVVPAGYAASRVTNGISHSGSSSLFLTGTGAGGQAATSLQQSIASAVAASTVHTVSYWLLLHTNPVTATVRTFPGSSLVAAATSQANLASPGAANPLARSLPPYDPLWLNEVQAQNTNGPTDSSGLREPWIELHNAGDTPVPLDGYFLADHFTGDLTPWPFPAGASIGAGEFKLIWADGEPAQGTATELHTSFRLPADGSTGSVALIRLVRGRPQVVDYLAYAGLPPGLSFGSVPDAQPFYRLVLQLPTPGAPNLPTALPLFINEWMASNTNTLADPADGDFEDWFELYNAGAAPINLAGFTLSDDAANPTKFRIPAGTMLPPHGFLLVWADEETGQNRPGQADLHVNFKLASAGESILLQAPDGRPVDGITFGPQASDVSAGRYGDGTDSIQLFSRPTPGGPNQLSGPGGSPPFLQAIPDRIVTVGQPLVFSAVASDPDQPPQTLTFALAGTVPLGAGIDAVTGRFAWTPSAAQAPGANEITLRVTDSGVPPQSAERTFRVLVLAPPRLQPPGRPVLGVIALTVQATPGKSYRVEYTDHLGSGVWTRLGPDRVANASSLLVEDSPGLTPQRFYRVTILD